MSKIEKLIKRFVINIMFSTMVFIPVVITVLALMDGEHTMVAVGLLLTGVVSTCFYACCQEGDI